MFKKLSLLFFILITAPNYTIDLGSKAKEGGKVDDICNIPTLLEIAISDKNPKAYSSDEKNPKKTNAAADDRISNLFSDFLATLATDSNLVTVLDDGIDSLKKFSTFLDSVDNTLHGINRLTVFKENKQWEALLKECLKSVDNKTKKKIREKISQEDFNDRKRKFVILLNLTGRFME